MEEDRRSRQDARRRAARLNVLAATDSHETDSKPRPSAGLRHARRILGRRTADRITAFLGRVRGPWRVAVSEASMLPSIAPGDWLLVDPTAGRWPRRGSVVVFHEPASGELAIKRVAAVPGDRVPFAEGFLHLAADEAWLVADATDEATAAAGLGPPIDSRRFGPVPFERYVGRAWFRYAPLRRIGSISRRASPPPAAPPEAR